MSNQITLTLPDNLAHALNHEAGLSFLCEETLVISALVRELRRRGYGLGKMTARERRWSGLEDAP